MSARLLLDFDACALDVHQKRIAVVIQPNLITPPCDELVLDLANGDLSATPE